MTKFVITTVVIITLGLIACSQSGPVPIYYGEDGCANCRMTIVDQQFGCQILSAKGKAFKFDSIECLAAYESENNNSVSFASAWVTDFRRAGNFVNRDDAFFVRSTSMRSPMGVGLFAFESENEAVLFAREHNGTILDFEMVKRVVEDVW